MIYFDSKLRQFTNPDAAQHFLRIVSDPRFDRSRLPYFKQYAGDGKKAFPTYPILGPNGGLDFAFCEWMELGYGIFDGYSDGEALLSWLGPMFFYDQEQIKFRVTDWRDRMEASRGSNNAWACAALTASDVALDGCVFDYCFDYDRYYYASVPAGVKPSDVAIPCIPQYPINVFGQRFTDPLALRDWELVTKARLLMLQRLVDGDWAATTVGDAYQEDGIIKFFDNWADRHSNLSSYCLTEFAPTTVPVTGETTAAKMAMFVQSITDELRQIEYRVRLLDGSGVIPAANVVLVMNEVDAMCMNYYQACTTKCSSTFNVNSPSDIAAFWEYFYSRFTGGMYGGGTVRLNDGRELSIMQNHTVPQGTAVMLIKGWAGSNPNPYGMRVAAMQYGEYYRRLVQTSPQAGLRYRTLMNGSWLEEMPTDGCGDKSIRFNMRLFTNAAWMQRKWTGIPACTEVSLTDWPSLPAMPTYSRCTPDHIGE